MTDFTTGETHAGSPTAIPVEAAMTWKAGRTIPEVNLSFDGTMPPEPLFAELQTIGWGVPAVPPRPSSAIEWTPDPVAGTDYTIHPWQVTEFFLARGSWSPDMEEGILAQTYAALQRYGIGIDAPSAQLQDLPAAPAEAPAAAATGGAPQIILIDYDGAPHPRFRPTAAIGGGRSRTSHAWSETADPVATICADTETSRALASDSNHAWEVRYATEPTLPSGSGQAAVCAAIPEVDAADKKLNKFVNVLGGSMQVASLSPLNGAEGTSGALVIGTVGASEVELAMSTLRLRYKNAIIRSESA